MQRILSGIQPSGVPHLGNYFGAMKQNVDMGNNPEFESFIFMADMHALTTVKDPAKLKEYTLFLALDYLALGLDPSKTVFFRQSDVPAHTELAWILACLTPHGLLERAHSWKDAQNKGVKDTTAGLFIYPVLMAADILLYKPSLVPVGKDQKQHLEIARDIATKFNNQYCKADKPLFGLPEEFTPKEVAIVPGSDGRKMSKSYGNTIEFFAEEGILKKQVMGIVTDSKGVEEKKDPSTCNVYQIFKLFLNETERKDLADKYKNGGLGYGEVKKMLLERIMDYFGPYRKKRVELEKNLDYIKSVLNEGADKANEFANKTLEEVKIAVGLK
ncbi:MAG: tryptophan--tRNA ligase [Candidatus Peregrinibacteria bacterium]|nr:tryptophan--tRNA ligase [Candidatus Peregrinibacteria bacterium]MDZ4244880.1 tryptophan--tRNA ligase [Candidatus Gracilibacteria bacterium]